MQLDLPETTFASRAELRTWLKAHSSTSTGIYVQIFKKRSGIKSVTFEDVLDEGLCFGWSESKRLSKDEQSYLQRFTPRKGRKTESTRNITHAKQLIERGLMTDAGLKALGYLD